MELEPFRANLTLLSRLHHNINPFELSPKRSKGDFVQLLLLDTDESVSSRSFVNSKFPSHLLLCRIGQPIDQQILHYNALVLVDIMEEISSTTAFIVRELGFERLAILGWCCALAHSFERVSIFVCVDLEDDALTVPASEVVELVHAAARDHLILVSPTTCQVLERDTVPLTLPLCMGRRASGEGSETGESRVWDAGQ
jgi:hypothetical protein